MSKHPETAKLPSEERIRAIAYSLWEEEGHPAGRDQEHWYRAVEIATAEMNDPDWLKRQVEAAATRVEAESTARVEGIARRKVA